ncbi:MAG: hypothetical protein KAX49_07255 [Halanaerobiales bacterium]|nr:hypothetical protein [Halanaerobiales bacterium]
MAELQKDLEKDLKKELDKDLDNNKPKTFTQDEVDALMGKTRSEAKKSVLKDLDVEDVNDTKKALKELKKIRESEKSDLQKKTEESEGKDVVISSLQTKINDIALRDETTTILAELEIDTKYSKTVLKLIDKKDLFEDEEIDSKELKSRVQKAIEDELPLLKPEDNKKLGKEKGQEKLPKSGSKSYLDKKYEHNPYYEG